MGLRESNSPTAALEGKRRGGGGWREREREGGSVQEERDEGRLRGFGKDTGRECGRISGNPGRE